MTEKHKNYNLVRYIVGWGFDGPIYATHFVSTEKPKNKFSPTGKRIPVVGWGVAKTSFKHEHNN